MNRKRIYYSFHETPFSQQYHDGIQQNSKIKFSKIEIYHILIAMTILTFSFSFALAPSPPLANIDIAISNIPLAFLAIITAFFCHDFAHKYMGQKYGYWSEFRMYPQGLLFALFLGIFVGIVFAAPGAVQIFGNPNKEEMGKISVAGPLTNLILSFIFLSIWFSSDGSVAFVSFFIAYINVFLALFNLLPFGPMDGLKIFRWKKEVWGLLFGMGVIIFITILTF